MKNKEKIIISLILIISTILSYILVEKYDFKMRMLPKCAWMWFYSYFDDETWKCSCYWWYVLKNRACVT
jgi:hypothetical protein